MVPPTHVGFTAGAIADERHEAALCIDNSVEALSCFRANTGVPRTLCVTLPQKIDWPEGDLHVHFSPPCTAFSRARCGSSTQAQLEAGVLHLKWSLETILAHNFTSYSLETVSVPRTRAVLDSICAAYPSRIAYHAFECADFGVPQLRKRIVAGRPEMIERLKAFPVNTRVSVSSAFGGEPAAQYIKNTTVSRGSGLSRCVRTVQEPAFTVCGSRSLSWCDANGKTVRVMKPFELAVLQSLPSSWVLPKGTRAATLATGNCVPPLLAKAIMKAAMGESPAPPPRKRSREDDDRLDRLERRVSDLESKLL